MSFKPHYSPLSTKNLDSTHDVEHQSFNEKDDQDVDGLSSTATDAEEQRLIDSIGFTTPYHRTSDAWRILVSAPSTYFILSGVLSATLLIFYTVILVVGLVISKRVEHMSGGIQNGEQTEGLDWMTWVSMPV